MGLDTKIYLLTDRQSQRNFDFLNSKDSDQTDVVQKELNV
jgi:hypothetical protein